MASASSWRARVLCSGRALLSYLLGRLELDDAPALGAACGVCVRVERREEGGGRVRQGGGEREERGGEGEREHGPGGRTRRALSAGPLSLTVLGALHVGVDHVAALAELVLEVLCLVRGETCGRRASRVRRSCELSCRPPFFSSRRAPTTPGRLRARPGRRARRATGPCRCSTVLGARVGRAGGLRAARARLLRVGLPSPSRFVPLPHHLPSSRSHTTQQKPTCHDVRHARLLTNTRLPMRTGAGSVSSTATPASTTCSSRLMIASFGREGGEEKICSLLLRRHSFRALLQNKRPVHNTS